MLIMPTTLTATSMSTAEQRLRLMQLASSNLPIGGYSWSQGLEWAVEAGWVPDVAAFERWQRRQMTEGFFTVDLPLFARLYRACEQGDIAAAQRWTAYLLACQGKLVNCGRKSATAARRFARLLSDWQPDCPPAWRTLCQQSQLAGMAWLGVRWRIALPEMALSLGYSWIESAVMAGVKLVPFRSAGRPAADFTSLRPLRGRDASRALAAPDGDIGSATPLAAIASARHETQYSRLFRS
ncbi:urease accessory protein UreF [Klebsiella variicola subsp. variicola]|nr:urease accessory protein UreF [Klebsiella variicola subsp. variicola]